MDCDMDQSGSLHELPERPRWLTDQLVDLAIQTYGPKLDDPFSESDAVELLLSLSQLLEVTGVLKLENDDETDEAIHRLGEGQQS